MANNFQFKTGANGNPLPSAFNMLEAAVVDTAGNTINLIRFPYNPEITSITATVSGIAAYVSVFKYDASNNFQSSYTKQHTISAGFSFTAGYTDVP